MTVAFVILTAVVLAVGFLMWCCCVVSGMGDEE